MTKTTQPYRQHLITDIFVSTFNFVACEEVLRPMAAWLLLQTSDCYLDDSLLKDWSKATHKSPEGNASFEALTQIHNEAQQKVQSC